MQLKNKQDFWSGIMFMCIGIGAAVGASQYSMGTSSRMGPGYFPFWLGICMGLLGAAIALTACSAKAEKTDIERFDLRIVGIVIGSVALTGVLLNYLGIYLSVFILVVLSSAASHVFSLKTAAITGVCLSVFVWLAFIKGLGLIFPLWPSVLSN